MVMSNDEAHANEAWKRLAVRRGANAYVLAGGLNRWLDVFAEKTANVPGPDSPAIGDDTLRHSFDMAIGARHEASRPVSELIAKRPFEAKVEVLTPVRAPGGGLWLDRRTKKDYHLDALECPHVPLSIVGHPACDVVPLVMGH